MERFAFLFSNVIVGESRARYLKALQTRAQIYLHPENYDAAVADFKSAIQQAKMEGNPTESHQENVKLLICTYFVLIET